MRPFHLGAATRGLSTSSAPLALVANDAAEAEAETDPAPGPSVSDMACSTRTPRGCARTTQDARLNGLLLLLLIDRLVARARYVARGRPVLVHSRPIKYHPGGTKPSNSRPPIATAFKPRSCGKR